MASFCASCGAATGGGKFCPKCGSAQTGGGAAFSPAQAPYPPAQRKSPVLKIVLISLTVLFVLGIAVLVKGYYFVKDRVIEAKQELAHVKGGPAQHTQAGCEIMTKDKVADVLGVKVVRAEGNEAGEMREYCDYFSQVTVAADQGDDGKSDESKDSQPGLKDLESIAKKISAAAKNRPLLSAQIYRGNAAAALIGIKTVSRLTGNNEPSIPGPWDEAYFGPKDAILAIRKGDNGLLLDLTRVDRKREAGLQIAKTMVSGL